jgi:hypothetical protein
VYCQLLDELFSDSFAASAGGFSVPGVLRRFLLRTSAVRGIREAIRQGVVDEGMIREFAERLLASFRVGVRFEHEVALAALAVVLERRATDFAEEFLLDLAKLRLAEMPLCIRVARECLKNRASIAQNKTRVFVLSNCVDRISLQQLARSTRHASPPIEIIGNSIDLRPSNAKA